MAARDTPATTAADARRRDRALEHVAFGRRGPEIELAAPDLGALTNARTAALRR